MQPWHTHADEQPWLLAFRDTADRYAFKLFRAITTVESTEEVEESCSSMIVGFDGVMGCDDTFMLHLQGIEYCIVEQSEE